MSFKKSQQGFSLLELMVVITIFLIITAVVMADIPNFGRKGALDLTAQEVAGCIRAAQVYGTAEKVVGTTKNDSIGVDFSGGNKIVIYKTSNNEEVEACNLEGYSLSVSGGVTGLTFPSTDYTKMLNSNLEPTFLPESEASSLNHVKITVTSLRNNEQRCVYVFASGQITVGSCDEN